jgi:Protein of unknown function (DUF3619)
MNESQESQFGNKVRHVLNYGLTVDASTAERLRAAREQALSRQKPESAHALAFAGHAAGRFGGWAGVALRVLLPLIMLLIAVGAIYIWQQSQRIAEIEEIDAQLLTDDLPIDAYLDRGFQNWLKQRNAEQ